MGYRFEFRSQVEMQRALFDENLQRFDKLLIWVTANRRGTSGHSSPGLDLNGEGSDPSVGNAVVAREVDSILPIYLVGALDSLLKGLKYVATVGYLSEQYESPRPFRVTIPAKVARVLVSDDDSEITFNYMEPINQSLLHYFSRANFQGWSDYSGFAKDIGLRSPSEFVKNKDEVRQQYDVLCELRHDASHRLGMIVRSAITDEWFIDLVDSEYARNCVESMGEAVCAEMLGCMKGSLAD
ncbi:hypothetical protein [Corynebacterium heidelbergense]|uniref:hypothetical protein n=1 Tax=Corynebacterium heidelbergense TaxID=2055947 RepID=UPI0011BE273A|nr:hypothetical protein [Corynebacterium heidelbergense]WCZ36141.1 hypothetical protein CHEID_02900 [Corynebacterium heidelbergense]